MTQWSPLRLEPILKPRVWGGSQLRDVWGKPYPTDEPYGESWEVAWRGDDTNRVTGGEFSGLTLEELAAKDRPGLAGTRLAEMPAFPLLAKILDCEQRLSVQVHPTPEYADKHAGAEVKMEAWYVMDAAENAEIIFGLQPGTTREEFAAAVEAGSLSDTLQRRSVSRGDVVLVTPGTVHALLEGLLVYEIQQSSDTTYRVYDWDRMGIDGKPRELHVAQALECINFRTDAPVSSPAALRFDAQTELLVATSAFALESQRVEGSTVRRLDGTRCELLTVVEGNGEVSGLGQVGAGETVFIPAGLPEYEMSGAMTVLIAYLPDLEKDIWDRARSVGHSDTDIRAVLFA